MPLSCLLNWIILHIKIKYVKIIIYVQFRKQNLLRIWTKVHSYDDILMFTVTTVPNTGCGCFCRTTNQSVDELILERKKELTVNKETLSATTRKLNCAEDSRTSSKVIGSIGVLILMIVVTLLILPDLCSLILFIMKKVQEYRKPIVIQMWLV